MGEFISKSSRLSIDGTKQPSGGRHSSMKAMVCLPAPHQGAVLARAEEGRVHKDHAISTDAICMSFMVFLFAVGCLFLWSFLGSLIQKREASVAIFFSFEQVLDVHVVTTFST
jgi:hypothetical protein